MSARSAIIGVGGSAIERHSERGIVAFAVDAARAAIDDAGLSLDDIDGYVGAPTATNAGGLRTDGADQISMKLLAGNLGLTGLTWGIDIADGFASDMAAAGTHAIAAGQATTVLGVRALYHLPGRAYAAVRAPRAYGAAQWTAPYGFTTAGARFAARARAYMEGTGATREDLYAIAALARDNGSRNPLSVWRGRPLSREDYLSARLISDPLCLFDCDLPVCGAAAFVITSAETAGRRDRPAAYVRGFANAHQAPSSVFDRAGVARDQVDVAQLYDGFSSMIWDNLEAFGFCEPGTAWKRVSEGYCAPSGDLPVNTFGGSLGEGRLHGMGHLREGVLQVTGRAGPRQIHGARTCLVQMGTFDASTSLLLSDRPY